MKLLEEISALGYENRVLIRMLVLAYEEKALEGGLLRRMESWRRSYKRLKKSTDCESLKIVYSRVIKTIEDKIKGLQVKK